MSRLQGSVSIFTGCRVHETASLILLKYVLGSANLGLNTSSCHKPSDQCSNSELTHSLSCHLFQTLWSDEGWGETGTGRSELGIFIYCKGEIQG